MWIAALIMYDDTETYNNIWLILQYSAIAIL